MIYIKIQFPTGKWHATAWGSHVNEGVVEWPPCPWRIIRAIVAAWHWKNGRDATHLCSVVEKLSSIPPQYFLPEASAAHSRHYMPSIAGNKVVKTKIFDAFLHITANQNLWIRWEIELNPEEAEFLQNTLKSISYLGRAESLVIASLEERLPLDSNKLEWTSPTVASSLKDGEPIRLLSPLSPNDFSCWIGRQEKPQKKKGKIQCDLPGSLLEALSLDTADWKKDGWNLPPGAHWIDYIRPRNCFKTAPRSGISRRRSTMPKVARFAVVSKVPPSITQSLSLSERFHQALCRQLSLNSESLTGCDDNHRPLVGNQHVYFLPECDKHGYITHMTLHAPMGFDDDACHALSRLNRVWGAEGFDINIILLATGQPLDFEIASPFFHKANRWISLTPFVPVRHPKATRSGIPKLDGNAGLQIGSPEHDCFRLLTLFDPQLRIVKIHTLGGRISCELRNIPCMDFQRNRHTGEGVRAGNRGYSLQIDFQDKVSMPFGLGYAAHFGLGLFVPVEAKPED